MLGLEWCLRGHQDQFLHLCRLAFAEVAGGPVSAGAAADDDDAAGILLLGVGHGGIEAGKDPFGVGGVAAGGAVGGLGGVRGFAIGCGGLGDVGIGVGRSVLGRCGLAGLDRLGRRCGAFAAGHRAFGEQVGKGQAQRAPVGVGELAPQWSDRSRPVGGLAGAGKNHQRALRRRAVGRFPQGKEVVAASLQGLLLFLGYLAFQGQGVFLAALDQRLALRGGRSSIRRGFWRFAILGLHATR